MTDTASAAPSEREKFEAWAQSLGLAHESNDPSAMWTWAAWQAALRAQPTPPAVVEPLTDEQVGEICDQFTKLVREKRARHIERGIDAGADYYIGDVAHYVGHAVNHAAHGIGIKKGSPHD